MSNFMETTCTKTYKVFMQILSQLCCLRYGKALSIKTISFDCLNFIYEINKCSLTYCNNQKVVNPYV